MTKSNVNYNSEWRKVAAAIYNKPTDSKMLGTVEVDVTDLEEYISALRKEGIKTTLTYWFTLALARGVMEKCPEFNTYVRRGKIIERKTLDVMVSVLLKGDQMGSVRIPNTHLFKLSELADFFKTEIDKARGGEENKTMQKKGLMAVLPWPFRNWLAGLVKLITVHWGLRLPGVVDANSFGSFVVTNIGRICLDMGLPAILKLWNLSIVLSMVGFFKIMVFIG
jgi:pyruvate dehydrogenase E2 component (dihydrolipoamide acetyltransferase)